jgi:hypothetical protein
MLLKRGPYGGIPLAKRVLIVAPSSLIGNWENEFTRWLGRDRLRLFSVDQVSYFHVFIYLICYRLNIKHVFLFFKYIIEKKTLRVC